MFGNSCQVYQTYAGIVVACLVKHLLCSRYVPDLTDQFCPYLGGGILIPFVAAHHFQSTPEYLFL